MATGTGKTRVSMAIVDSLVNKAKSVTNVLFVVDRIALGNNAFYKGFQKFFRDTPQGLLNLEKNRMILSTKKNLISLRDFMAEQFYIPPTNKIKNN